MFFTYSLDSKPEVVDPNGNTIINLAVSPLNKHQNISSYRMKVVPYRYKMRPDLIALVEMGNVNMAEYIMMFNQVGNPFSIDEDDVLLIPDGPSADAMMISYDDNNRAYTNITDKTVEDILVQNYYRYAGRQNYVDMQSYDDFLKSSIPSGNTETSETPKNTAPYLLNDNEEAVVFKDGKIFFNDSNDVALKEEDLSSENIDKTISDILNGVATNLSGDNCSYNGTSLSDFIKALNNNTQE